MSRLKLTVVAQVHGERQYPNGDHYTGSLSADQRHGKGVCVFADGSSFDGLWVEDRPSHGRMTLRNGDVYEGHFLRNRLRGQGKYYRKGRVLEYTGEFKNNLRHGKGEGVVPDVVGGGHYTGTWQDDVPHGQGKWVLRNGDIYVGQVVVGERWGEGTMHYSNGAYYCGKWEHNMRHGVGMWRDLPGTPAVVSEWRDDVRHHESSAAASSPLLARPSSLQAQAAGGASAGTGESSGQSAGGGDESGGTYSLASRPRWGLPMGAQQRLAETPSGIARALAPRTSSASRATPSAPAHSGSISPSLAAARRDGPEDPSAEPLSLDSSGGAAVTGGSSGGAMGTGTAAGGVKGAGVPGGAEAIAHGKLSETVLCVALQGKHLWRARMRQSGSLVSMRDALSVIMQPPEMPPPVDAEGNVITPSPQPPHEREKEKEQQRERARRQQRMLLASAFERWSRHAARRYLKRHHVAVLSRRFVLSSRRSVLQAWASWAAHRVHQRALADVQFLKHTLGASFLRDWAALAGHSRLEHARKLARARALLCATSLVRIFGAWRSAVQELAARNMAPAVDFWRKKLMQRVVAAWLHWAGKVQRAVLLKMGVLRAFSNVSTRLVFSAWREHVYDLQLLDPGSVYSYLCFKTRISASRTTVKLLKERPWEGKTNSGGMSGRLAGTVTDGIITGSTSPGSPALLLASQQPPKQHSPSAGPKGTGQGDPVGAEWLHPKASSPPRPERVRQEAGVGHGTGPDGKNAAGVASDSSAGGVQGGPAEATAGTRVAAVASLAFADLCLGDRGICALMDTLCHCVRRSGCALKLASLDLSGNCMGDATLAHVLAIARRWPHLRVLNLARNAVTSAGAAAIIAHIRQGHAPCLVAVDVSGNYVGQAYVRVALRVALDWNQRRLEPPGGNEMSSAHGHGNAAEGHVQPGMGAHASQGGDGMRPGSHANGGVYEGAGTVGNENLVPVSLRKGGHAPSQGTVQGFHGAYVRGTKAGLSVDTSYGDGSANGGIDSMQPEEEGAVEDEVGEVVDCGQRGDDQPLLEVFSEVISEVMSPAKASELEGDPGSGDGVEEDVCQPKHTSVRLR
eukprot:jgi/Mesvir1/27027/Mv20729-RA.1